jgi:hypothetical protein
LVLVSQPNGLDLVDGFPLPNLLGYSLGLLLWSGLFLIFTFVLNLSIIRLICLIDFLSWLGDFLLIFNLLSDLLGNEELDWVLNEL